MKTEASDIRAGDGVKKAGGGDNKKDDDYNPFEHRALEKGNSDIRSVANLIKSSLGSGLLAMPLAFSNSGWGVGIVSTLVISFVCGHCVHILVKTSRECCKLEKEPFLGYAETCESVFSNGPQSLRRFRQTARVFADLALILTYLAICCVYTILIADSVKQLVDRYISATTLEVELYCLILLVPFALICQVKSLKWLAPFSLLANVLLFLTFVICLYYVFSEGISLENRRVSGDISRYPAFLSTVIFALEGVGVVMPTENSMKKPQNFLGCPSVLVVAMVIITFMYTSLGLFGYFRFGDELLGSITLNLPIDDGPAIAAKVFIIIAVFLTYPLQFFVGMDVMWRHLKPRISDKYQTVCQVLLRAFAVCVCTAIAIALPMLEQIIAIVGALFFSILGLIVPAILETVFYWNRSLGPGNWMLWKNLIVGIFGFIALSTGCSVAIMEMIQKIHERE